MGTEEYARDLRRMLRKVQRQREKLQVFARTDSDEERGRIEHVQLLNAVEQRLLAALRETDPQALGMLAAEIERHCSHALRALRP